MQNKWILKVFNILAFVYIPHLSQIVLYLGLYCSFIFLQIYVLFDQSS